MLSNIFEFYYTTNMHPARLKPLTRDELCKGMSADAVDKYLSLMEQLYNAYYIDLDDEFVPLPREELHQKRLVQDRLFKDITKLLFKQDAISDNVYLELHKIMPVEYNSLDHPIVPGKSVGDSLDDFRLAFEYGILECDENIDLRDEYLDDRYGHNVCVRPGTPNGLVTSKDLCVIRYEGTYPNATYVYASYWEVKYLLATIRKDMERNTDDLNLLDKMFRKEKHTKRGYIDSLQITTYGRPKNIAEWYTMKRALEKEADLLWRIEEQISSIFDTTDKPTDGVGFGATLFIYKGKVLCHTQKHPLVPATALIHDDQDREIELDVEYCPTCKRYMLSYTSYEQYRERHGLLIAKMKMISGNSSGGEFDMASEGPLKLCGYNVSQAEGLSATTRQFLLAKIIHDGIMTKLDVIHYLEQFINMNGAKKDNVLALEKWCDDLDFVHKYNNSTQPRVYIDKIKKY